MNVRVLKSMSWVLALAIAALAPIALSAQDTAKPAAKPAASSSASPSKWDIFLGYSYIAPFGTVNSPTFGTASTPVNFVPVNLGAIGSISYFFNKNWGAQIEGDAHPQDLSCASYNTSQPVVGFGAHPLAQTTGCVPTRTPAANSFYGGSGGVIYRWPGEKLTPFVHALMGAEREVGEHYFRLELTRSREGHGSSELIHLI